MCANENQRLVAPWTRLTAMLMIDLASGAPLLGHITSIVIPVKRLRGVTLRKT